jgi:hypothetical protein|tara:strand:+ start:3971 stop:4270 length:300 start_codon:yes stop_codon:yes gene_type:complete
MVNVHKRFEEFLDRLRFGQTVSMGYDDGIIEFNTSDMTLGDLIEMKEDIESFYETIENLHFSKDANDYVFDPNTDFSIKEILDYWKNNDPDNEHFAYKV